MSYDSRYDPRDHRPSRRHDSFTKPREYLSPITTNSDRKLHGLDHGHYHRRTNDGRRSSPHSGPSSDDSRSRIGRSPRRTHSWPPAPMVESEARSLMREVGGRRILHDITRNEIPSRGTIDQDPVIEEVPEFVNRHERRFVVVSDSEASKSKVQSMPTPPTSEDERLRKARRRPSRIRTEFDTVQSEVTASPYSTSRPASAHPQRTPREAYLSPTASVAAFDRREQRTPANEEKSRTPRTSPALRSERSDSRQDEYAISDSDDSRRPGSRDGAQQARLGGSRGLAISSADSGRKALLVAPTRDLRRSTDTATSLPSPQGLAKASRPSTLAAAGTIGAAMRLAGDRDVTTPKSASLNPPPFCRQSSTGSRNASPVSIHSQRSASPPSRSPRYSTDYSQDHDVSPDSRKASTVGSRAESRANSPPRTIQMPKAPPMPDNELDWNNYIAANTSRRRAGPTASKQPSKLSTSMRADSSPAVPRAAGSSAGRPSVLPYPINDGPATPDVFMPFEQDHQWFPSTTQANVPEARPVRSQFGDVRPVRPARHSFTGVSSDESKPMMQRSDTAARPATTAVGPTKQEADAMIKRGLPGCSRPEPTANYDDWYTMVGAPTLDFCPKCIESIFERTVYRKYFRRSLPRDLKTKIACAFGSPWIRLAYLLTVQQRLADLLLFKDLAEIDRTSDPCPKNEEAVRSWYGLKDDQGLFVRDFQVCYADVRKLERLLPTFSGFFQRLPNRASYESKKCSLRAETNRFTQYLNSIIELHDQAHATRTLPDRMPFVALVERKLSLRECERDALLLESLWHYIPALPMFTVCEDCYEDVVEPAMKKGSELARRFNRAVQPAYGEGIGTSCQLYSPRMRKVFHRAVKDNDLKYLTRKAKERRDAEVRLQEKHASVVRRLERYDAQGRDSSDDEDSRRRLARDLKHIVAEWKEDWE